MLTQQRHEIILKLLKEKGSITVTEVRDLLDTSESTVRRDITALDKEGSWPRSLRSSGARTPTLSRR